MNILTALFSNTFVAFLILISIVVVGHELGHFLVGRLLGIGVEEFSVGFGPKAFSFKIGQTVYRFNWLPLGGYVRFYGADLTKEISKKERERSILHAKLYKRMLVAVAGPFANFVLSFFIMFSLYSYGVTKYPAVFRVLSHSVAYKDGLRSGDKITSIDGQEISDWSRLTQKISSSPETPLNVQVERNGEQKSFTVTPLADMVSGLNGEPQTVGRIGITPFFSAPLIAPWKGQIFEEIGLRANDKVLSINGDKIQYLDQFLNEFSNSTKSDSDVSLAKYILKNQIPVFNITIQRGTITKVLLVDLNSRSAHSWAKQVLKKPQELKHGLWMDAVGSSELTIKELDQLSPQSKQYAAKQSLSECGLKANDTIRKVDNSNLFSSQIGFFTWLESQTNTINKKISQFKNNSLKVDIYATGLDGKEAQYSCFLPIRHGKSEIGKEKLFIDFPVKFVSSPIALPTEKLRGGSVFEDVNLAFKSIISQTTFIYTGFKKLFSGSVPLSALGGPIAIAGFAGDAAKAGIETFFLAMSLMSVNIGIFNLLPLPALDGGMLLLQIVEFFYRKPLPQKVQMLIARFGIAFLLTLFLFVFYNDIMRLFTSG